MTVPERAVFDCNVLLQALLSSRGPAGRLLEAAEEKKLTLFISSYVIEELREVASRPKVQRKFQLSADMIEQFCRDLVGHATVVDVVPHVFDFPRDPDDAHYVDLAVAVNAKLVVSRDQDLLSLRDASTHEGRDFAARFPGLEILTPPEALRRLDEAASE